MKNKRSASSYPADVEELIKKIECLVVSHNRLRIMYLLANSPLTISDMQEALGVHRTTLGRNINKLKKMNLVSSSPTENLYRLTIEGEMIIDAFDELIETTRDAKRLGSFLSRIPEAIPVKREHLDSVRITCPETGDPLASMSRLFELFETATHIRGSIPVLGPMEGNVIIDQISDHTRVTLILRSTTYESLRTNHPQLFTSLWTDGAADLLVSEELPSYGLFLLDEMAVITAYDDDMRIHSILETRELQDLVNWVGNQIEEQCEKGSPNVPAPL